MLEFQAFINRTADGTSGAGYYEFRTKKVNRRQVPTARIVKLVVYPKIEEIKEIVTPEDRKTLISKIEELQATGAKYPATGNYLEPSIRRLYEELAQYDSGKVKIEGAWVSKQSFDKEKAIKLAGLLRAEIARAKPASSLDLGSDPRFISLRSLAQGNPEAERLAGEVYEQHEQLVRAERRTDLLSGLSKSDTSLAEAEAILDDVKLLRPEEDPESAATMKVWALGMAAVRATTADAEEICKSMERELANVSGEQPPAHFSPALERRISSTSAKIKDFLASNPPRQLASAVQRAANVCMLGANFKELKANFEGKRYLEARDILDNFAREVNLFGPETMRVVSELRRRAAEKVDQFTRLRDEAKLLANSGKKPEALAKFEAAFSVIPDLDVRQHIAKLRQDILAASAEVQ